MPVKMIGGEWRASPGVSPMPTRARCCRPVAGASARRATLLLATILCVPLAHAGVYKCAGENGTVVYQEDACAQGKELRNFDTDPPDLSIIPGRAVPAPSLAPREPKSASLERRDSADKARGKVTGDATDRKFI